MTLRTVDAYGAPSYGPIGRPPAGIVFHTPENADFSLQAAIATAQWQATSGNTSGGSYHGILALEGVNADDPDAWTMVRSVPWDQAAGGLSSQRTDPPWAPYRHPWIEQLLPIEAFRDPNRWMHQIALGGKAAWYEENGYPPALVTALTEWVKTLEDAYQYDALLTCHRHWQTDRTDPGPVELIDLILTEYQRLYGTGPTPEPVQRFSDVPRSYWAYQTIEWAAESGLTTGYPDGSFRPDAPATRAEVLSFLKRLDDAR